VFYYKVGKIRFEADKTSTNVYRYFNMLFKEGIHFKYPVPPLPSSSKLYCRKNGGGVIYSSYLKDKDDRSQ